MQHFKCKSSFEYFGGYATKSCITPCSIVIIRPVCSVIRRQLGHIIVSYVTLGIGKQRWSNNSNENEQIIYQRVVPDGRLAFAVIHRSVAERLPSGTHGSSAKLAERSQWTDC